jgi:hypothetical protein
MIATLKLTDGFAGEVLTEIDPDLLRKGSLLRDPDAGIVATDLAFRRKLRLVIVIVVIVVIFIYCFYY